MVNQFNIVNQFILCGFSYYVAETSFRLNQLVFRHGLFQYCFGKIYLMHSVESSKVLQILVECGVMNTNFCSVYHAFWNILSVDILRLLIVLMTLLIFAVFMKNSDGFNSVGWIMFFYRFYRNVQ